LCRYISGWKLREDSAVEDHDEDRDVQSSEFRHADQCKSIIKKVVGSTSKEEQETGIEA
jgi:hypothetical protein